MAVRIWNQDCLGLECILFTTIFLHFAGNGLFPQLEVSFSEHVLSTFSASDVLWKRYGPMSQNDIVFPVWTSLCLLEIFCLCNLHPRFHPYSYNLTSKELHVQNCLMASLTSPQSKSQSLSMLPESLLCPPPSLCSCSWPLSIPAFSFSPPSSPPLPHTVCSPSLLLAPPTTQASLSSPPLPTLSLWLILLTHICSPTPLSGPAQTSSSQRGCSRHFQSDQSFWLALYWGVSWTQGFWHHSAACNPSPPLPRPWLFSSLLLISKLCFPASLFIACLLSP